MKVLHFMLCFMLLSLLTGCWNVNEVNRIAIVFGAGIDQLDNGEYELTLQIVIPTSNAQGPSGNVPGRSFMVLTKKGKTVGEIVENLMHEQSRHVFFGHTKMLVFGEKVSKSGVKEIIDWFERYREFRFPFVFIAEGKAKEVLSTSMPLEKIPALGMQHMISFRYRHLSRLTPTLNQFCELFYSPSKVSYATRIGIKKIPKEKKLQIIGLGLFKDGKLFFQPNNNQVIDFLFFRPESINGGTILIPCSENPKKFSTFEFDRKKTKVKIERIKNNPVYNITVETEGSIEGTDCREKIYTPEQIEKIEKELNEIIKKRMTNFVNLAQKKYKIDFLRLDENLREQDFSYWSEVENQWEDIFPTIEVNINVKSHIKEVSGATYNPIQEDK